MIHARAQGHRRILTAGNEAAQINLAPPPAAAGRLSTADPETYRAPADLG
jgi:hypothetical protein